MTNFSASGSLNEDYLRALGPKGVKPKERDKQGYLRINSLWMTGDELRSLLPKLAVAKERERVEFNERHLAAGGDEAGLRPEGIKFLYTMRMDGTVVYGAEDVADLLPADDYQRLVAGMANNPAYRGTDVEAHLRDGLQGQGHVGIAASFDAVGRMLKMRSRVSGELWYFVNRNESHANDKSGRYMSERVRPRATYEQLKNALTNVCTKMSEELGIAITPQMIKNAHKEQASAAAVTSVTKRTGKRSAETADTSAHQDRKVKRTNGRGR